MKRHLDNTGEWVGADASNVGQERCHQRCSEKGADLNARDANGSEAREHSPRVQVELAAKQARSPSHGDNTPDDWHCKAWQDLMDRCDSRCSDVVNKRLDDDDDNDEQRERKNEWQCNVSKK